MGRIVGRDRCSCDRARRRSTRSRADHRPVVKNAARAAIRDMGLMLTTGRAPAGHLGGDSLTVTTVSCAAG
jgi:hypothetical protein